jgi:hypothetical protein
VWLPEELSKQIKAPTVWFINSFKPIKGFLFINLGAIGLDESVPCEATKSDTSNHKFKALFGGSRTHNKQILIHLCRVIVSWVTFYNTEAVSNWLVRILYQFPSAGPYLLSPAGCTEDILCPARLQA